MWHVDSSGCSREFRLAPTRHLTELLMIDNSRGWLPGRQKEIEARTNISELPRGVSEVDNWYRSMRR
jgi:hypothetical protein